MRSRRGRPAGSANPEDPSDRRQDDFVQRIAQLIAKSTKRQAEIARDMGYTHPNIISMLKLGATRLPLDKVGSFAFSVEADEAELVRLWLAVYMPEVKGTLERALSGRRSPAEQSWLDGLREAFGDDIPALNEDARFMLRLLAKCREHDKGKQ